MLTQSSQNTGQNDKRKSWERETVAELMTTFQALRRQGWSQRQFADEQDVARTTLQQWLNRASNMEAPPEVVAFFESPAGLAFLHRLVSAAHLVMNNMGTCGIRMVALMLGLAGVGPFVGLSYGAHQKIAATMEESILLYEGEQRPKLASQMAHKKISICEDETFPASGLCLVAVEPVSGFIVLEEYSNKRDAKTWNGALQEATGDLDVDIVQSASDEARALLRHAKDQGAHHSPDLFHVLHEINAALVLPLRRLAALAREAHDKAFEKLQREEEREAAYAEDRPRGRPPAFEQRIAAAHQEVEKADAELKAVQAYQDRRKSAVASISMIYHPYDLQTGARRGPEQVKSGLDAQFHELRGIIADAGLSERSQEGVEKAARVAPKMVATVNFFHETVRTWVEARGLPAEQESLLHKTLIPAAHLSNAADKASPAASAAELRAVADSVRAPLRAPDGPWSQLALDQQHDLAKLAQDCADLFQRSSSCVEGRNSRLGLWEHALRHISPGKLRALTIVQNYFVSRPDGSTSAERFFGIPPAHLFEYLLNKLAMPPRPRRSRVSKKKQHTFKRDSQL